MGADIAISVGSEPVSETFSTTVYSLNAIKAAAYRLGDKCYVRITPRPDGIVEVSLTPKKPLDREALVGSLANEVLDQDLRERIAVQTEGIRNLILAQAFSSQSLTRPSLDAADYHVDPMRIASPVTLNRSPR